MCSPALLFPKRIGASFPPRGIRIAIQGIARRLVAWMVFMARRRMEPKFFLLKSSEIFGTITEVREATKAIGKERRGIVIPNIIPKLSVAAFSLSPELTRRRGIRREFKEESRLFNAAAPATGIATDKISRDVGFDFIGFFMPRLSVL